MANTKYKEDENFFILVWDHLANLVACGVTWQKLERKDRKEKGRGTKRKYT